MEKWEQVLAWGGMKRDITFLVISGIALLCSILNLFHLPFDLAWIAIVLCGLPIIIEAIIGLVTAFDIKADVLVSLALIASVCIGEHFAAGEVAFIMQLGALLEDLTVAKARAGIEKLVRLTPQTARVLYGDTENIIPAEQVRPDDLIRVLPGETVPVDGIIVSGQTAINQAVMTGESLPVDKTVGDNVASGTVNQFGAFVMKATKVGEDSSIQRMIRLVQSADAGKAEIVHLADRWATWIVVIALSSALLTWLITGEIIRAVTILVVFCPCALVLATPTAIMAAIGNATRHGFLVREGDALERLANVKKIAFDKTGTLTFGKPEVTAIKSHDNTIDEKTLFRIAASAEYHSEHPLGKAVLQGYLNRYGQKPTAPDAFTMMPGKGISAQVDDRKVLAGNLSLLSDHQVAVPEAALASAAAFLNRGATVVYLAFDKQFAGFITLSDTLRPASTAMVQSLQKTGCEPVLLTGDTENAAKTVAEYLGIRECHFSCLPEDKLNHIHVCQDKGLPVCMVGDGINDAPALKTADVGIAMGGIGSDISVDAADIVLVDDKVEELPHLLALSKRMMHTIKLNMTFSMLLNFAAIALAFTGLLTPVWGALVHNAGSVAVIVNSALLLQWRAKPSQ